MIKKPEKQEFNIFSFMGPLDMRIWIFTGCSYVGVCFKSTGVLRRSGLLDNLLGQFVQPL